MRIPRAVVPEKRPGSRAWHGTVGDRKHPLKMMPGLKIRVNGLPVRDQLSSSRAPRPRISKRLRGEMFDRGERRLGVPCHVRRSRPPATQGGPGHPPRWRFRPPADGVGLRVTPTVPATCRLERVEEGWRGHGGFWGGGGGDSGHPTYPHWVGGEVSPAAGWWGSRMS